VYDALGLAWTPEVTGSVESERAGTSWDAVREALLAEYARDYDLVEAGLDDATLALARELAPEHRV
jgi:octanoyl-[GcvH]:protein N-octanoyltransferase